MDKLKLNLEALGVESFETQEERLRRGDGTVRGFAGYTGECPGYTCTRAMSRCEYPTAVHHNCPPGYTDDEVQCGQLQPQSYYCFEQSAPYPC